MCFDFTIFRLNAMKYYIALDTVTLINNPIILNCHSQPLYFTFYDQNVLDLNFLMSKKSFKFFRYHVQKAFPFPSLFFLLLSI